MKFHSIPVSINKGEFTNPANTNKVVQTAD